MGQNYNSVGATIALLLRHDPCRIAGMPGCRKSNQSSPSVSLSVYFSQTILSFSDFSLFFLAALLSCLFFTLFAVSFSVLSAIVAHWSTSSINLSKNGLDMLYFAPHYVISFFLFFTVHPLSFSFFTLIFSSNLPVPLLDYPSIQLVSSFSIYYQI